MDPQPTTAPTPTRPEIEDEFRVPLRRRTGGESFERCQSPHLVSCRTYARVRESASALIRKAASEREKQEQPLLSGVPVRRRFHQAPQLDCSRPGTKVARSRHHLRPRVKGHRSGIDDRVTDDRREHECRCRDGGPRRPIRRWSTAQVAQRQRRCRRQRDRHRTPQQHRQFDHGGGSIVPRLYAGPIEPPTQTPTYTTKRSAAGSSNVSHATSPGTHPSNGAATGGTST